MMFFRSMILTLVLAGLTSLVSVRSAEASLSQDVARGFQLFDWRFSATNDLLSDGFTVNAGVNYNNREFDFGNGDLTLSGTLLARGSFSKRGIPEVEFSMNSGGQPLNYAFNINTGAQDFNATGSVLIDMATTVNKYGFYDQELIISNRGSYDTDGYLLSDDDTLDFDIGPVDIHGNLYVDALAAVTQPLFSAVGSDNFFAKISGRAQRTLEAERTRDQYLSRMEAGEILSDEEMNTLMNNIIMAAVLGGESTEGLLDNPLLASQNLMTNNTVPSTAAFNSSAIQVTPEPSTLLLMLGLLPIIGLVRRCKR